MVNRIVTLLFLVLSFSAWGDCSHTATRFNCVKYVKNYDGDTVTVNIPGLHPIVGKKISVRVNGIDTPEKRTKDKCEKKLSRTAQKLTQSLLKNAKRIDLINVQRGKYFRIVADVIADGKNIGDILIKNKLAYEYHGKTKTKMDWCR